MKSIQDAIVLFALFFVRGFSGADEDDWIVRVDRGLLRGRFLNDIRGNKFHAFTAIPFAQPPVGNLRFKAPRATESWSGIFNATKDSVKCPQLDARNEFVGDENCLTLNVFCHSLSRNNSLPVLFYIHGGAFQQGSASLSDMPPNRLMSHGEDFVLVTIQYRLLSLGFLSTGDSVATGNYGLLDQILALKWVKKNIAQFGGDPERVTLVGNSAGGMSIGLHMVSPLAVGLFRGAFIISGSSLMNVVIQKDPLPIAELLGKEVKCHSNATSILVDCLRGKSARDLAVAAYNLTVTSGQFIPLSPVIEKSTTGSYLISSPEKLFKEGKFIRVPTVLGTTKDEMATFILPYPPLQYLKLIPTLTDAMIDQLFEVLLPPQLHLFLKYDNVANLSLAVRREYGKEYNFTLTKHFFQFLIDMSTDGSFRAGTDKLVRLLAPRVTTYLYELRYHGDFVSPTNFGDKEVDHEQTMIYFTAPTLSERDARMSAILVKQLLNFVKHLNPNQSGQGLPKWTPTRDACELRHLSYSDTRIATKRGYYTREMKFWNTLAPKIESGEA